MTEDTDEHDHRSRHPAYRHQLAQMQHQAGLSPAVRVLVVVVLLYGFLVGVSLLEAGIAALGSDVQESLFGRVSNPLAGVFVGLLGTVLVQSSSVSTSTIVALVGSGLLGVDDAVPMVMGANMGTTVTNTLASLGHLRHGPEFKRAFAAATVHDFFNVLSVAVLLPLELIFGAVSRPAEWLTDRLAGTSGATWKSPFKEWVKEPVGRIQDGLDSVGAEGNVLAILLLVVGLAFIFGALALITKNMRSLVADRVERSVNAVLGRGGGLVAMAIGIIITIAVQSSSITTSILVPLAASGVLTLRNAYPVTLGANVGTTVTALLASLATNRPEALTVALAHTLFNVFGIMIFYPVPALRDLPPRLAEALGGLAVRRRSLALAYALGAFVIVPLIGLVLLG
ncbi:MAG TPA: Na/Pi symporter [Acidimicrobiales bacterium]